MPYHKIKPKKPYRTQMEKFTITINKKIKRLELKIKKLEKSKRKK